MTIDSISNNTYIKIGNKGLGEQNALGEPSLVTLYNDLTLHRTSESAKALEINGDEISSDSNWYVFAEQDFVDAFKRYLANEEWFQKAPLREQAQEAIRALDKMSQYWEAQGDSKDQQRDFNGELPRFRDYNEFSRVADEDGYNIIRQMPDGLYEIKLGSFHIISTGVSAYLKKNATSANNSANVESKDLFVNIVQNIQNLSQNALAAQQKSQSDCIMQTLFDCAKTNKS